MIFGQLSCGRAGQFLESNAWHVNDACCIAHNTANTKVVAQQTALEFGDMAGIVRSCEGDPHVTVGLARETGSSKVSTYLHVCTQIHTNVHTTHIGAA